MRIFYVFLIAGIVSLLGIVSYHVAYDQYERQAVDMSRERLTLYRATLRSTLERISHLPRVARLYSETRAIVKRESPPDKLNLYLKSISDAAGSAAIYVLDENANTISASNFDTPESFVGNNYRFRPYFTDAMKNGTGEFFAVGVTTGRPGYFMSEAIMEDGRPIGVAVVKVEFLELLEDWKTANENVLISDANDVVVLASRHERLYKTLSEISPERLSEMKESRKFSDFELEPLLFEAKGNHFSDMVELDSQRYVVTTVDAGGIGWNLHFLTPLETVQRAAMVVPFIVFLICGLAVIGILYVRSRLQQDRMNLIASEAERIRKINVQLENEIGERKKTEAQLRDTQAELIQSSRLAALGKMSAAIVHEVNQPVSAIRMFTSSGSLLVNESRIDEVKQVFQEIRKMTERLGAITSDLLVFSRKPVNKREVCDLNDAVKEIVSQYRAELDALGMTVSLNLDSRGATMTGSMVRIEQLVSNLLKNAMDAAVETEDREITITTWRSENLSGLSVKDEGKGIPPEIMGQLFDPFFTTKEIGSGVGLGLALCYAIAEEAKGHIRCENNPDGGAVFHVEFPLSRKKRTVKRKELEDA